MTDSAEEKFKGMLLRAELPIKASYRPGEVCSILGICQRTFWYLTERFERDGTTGLPVHPGSLDSYLLRRERRVRYEELVDYLSRNNTYQRRNAPDSRQMKLFE